MSMMEAKFLIKWHTLESFKNLVGPTQVGWASEASCETARAKLIPKHLVNILMDMLSKDYKAGAGAIVRLGSVIYNVGGETLPELNPYQDSDHHIHRGTSFLELSKPHLLSLLNQGDVDYDDPSKSGSGSGSGSTRWKGGVLCIMSGYIWIVLPLGVKFMLWEVQHQRRALARSLRLSVGSGIPWSHHQMIFL